MASAEDVYQEHAENWTGSTKRKRAILEAQTGRISECLSKGLTGASALAFLLDFKFIGVQIIGVQIAGVQILTS